MKDLHRQRVLERAGWTFWRCWGSSFIRDPEACMADLFQTLERLEIEPLGAVDLDLNEIVEYREVTAFPPSEAGGDESEADAPIEPPSDTEATGSS